MIATMGGSLTTTNRVGPTSVNDGRPQRANGSLRVRPETSRRIAKFSEHEAD
jgi:hypothetical protein